MRRITEKYFLTKEQTLKRKTQGLPRVGTFKEVLLVVVAAAACSTGCHAQDSNGAPNAPSDGLSPGIALVTHHPRNEEMVGGYVDASGNEHALPFSTSSRRPGAMADYFGCDQDYFDTYSITYNGFSVTNNPATGARTIQITWTHDVPSGTALSPSSSDSYGRIRLSALSTAATCATTSVTKNSSVGVNRISTYVHPVWGLQMSRYRVSYAFEVSDQEYNQYSYFTTTYRIATDCADLGVIYPQPKTDPLAPSALLVAAREDSLAVRSNATVWGGGTNTGAMLGDGAGHGEHLSPVQAAGLTCIKAVSAHLNHSLALRFDGTVWSVGDNFVGQVGPNDTSAYFTQVPDLTDVIAIAAGDFYSLALLSDGTVWGWGSNYLGRIGNNNDGISEMRQITPAQAIGLTNATAIAAGSAHSLALRRDGTVWAWGWNESGQLGVGSTSNRLIPTQVPGLSNVVAVEGGWNFSLALRADGTVLAWGDNSVGQLGLGSTVNKTTPIQVPGLSNITAVSAGGGHALALRTDGTVFAWGDNSAGQLGVGSTTNYGTPIQVPGLNNIIAVAAGTRHSLALKADGTVLAWGYNSTGQLANGTKGSPKLSPIPSQLR